MGTIMLSNLAEAKLAGQTVVAPSRALAPSGSGLCRSAGSVTSDSAVSGAGNTWADLRDERPTRAPRAVVAAEHGGYAQVIGAGRPQQQDEQINQAVRGFRATTTIRKRAFRGPEPWRKRP